MQKILAANFTAANRMKFDINTLTIHDGETGEDKTSAEGMGNFFHNQRIGNDGSSAHYGCDVDSKVMYVEEKNVAWAAPFNNHDGIQMEHAGRASQTKRDWLDPYSIKMLRDVSAPLAAEIVIRYSLPIHFCRAVDLAAGKRGITTHWEVTKAYSHGQGHTDPGPNFPMEQYLIWVTECVKGLGHTSVALKGDHPLLKQGDTGWRVKQLQRLLNFPTEHDIPVNGSFTPATFIRLQAFQKNHHLIPDGIVGPNTWDALWAARYA